MKFISLEQPPRSHYFDIEKFFSHVNTDKIVFVTLSNSINSYNGFNPHPCDLDTDINFDIDLKDDEYLFIFTCYESSYLPIMENKLIQNLWENDIDTDRVYIVHNNPNNTTTKLKTIYWDYFETVVRMQHDSDLVYHKKKTKFAEIDVSKKRHDKKFLCLNYHQRPHRKNFMFAMRDRGLLDQFNASLWEEELQLRYDYHGTIEDSPNLWYSNEERFAYENSIFVVTETLFQDTYSDLIFLTEKIFKPMLLKMPFILVGQSNTLKRLKDMGYKTFGHMWDESYDTINNSQTRLNTIVELVSFLSTQNVQKIVDDNNEIYEHNYKTLMSSFAEKEIFDTIRSLK